MYTMVALFLFLKGMTGALAPFSYLVRLGLQYFILHFVLMGYAMFHKILLGCAVLH